jgi:hypothetical protein
MYKLIWIYMGANWSGCTLVAHVIKGSSME